MKSESLNNKIIKLMNLITSINESDDISEIERENKLKVLKAKLTELKLTQVRIIKELGR